MRIRSVLVACLLMSGLSAAAPAQEAAAVETTCTEMTWGYRCLYGPFHVTYSREGTKFQGAVKAPPIPGFITGGQATLVNRAGKPLDRHAAHLHHVVFLDLSQPDMTCPLFPGDRFFASGKERTKVRLPDGYGIPWSNEPPKGYPQAGPLWGMVLHIHAMHKGYDAQAYVRFDVRFEPESSALTPARPVWLDVRNCSTSEYDVPRSTGGVTRHKEVWHYQMPAAGRFITMGGHLHDGGLLLRLRNVTKGTGVFTSRAEYANRPSDRWDLTGMGSFSSLERPGTEIDEGDLLKLVSVYNSTKARPGAMGIMVGVLAPPSSIP